MGAVEVEVNSFNGRGLRGGNGFGTPLQGKGDRRSLPRLAGGAWDSGRYWRLQTNFTFQPPFLARLSGSIAEMCSAFVCAEAEQKAPDPKGWMQI